VLHVGQGVCHNTVFMIVAVLSGWEVGELDAVFMGCLRGMREARRPNGQVGMVEMAADPLGCVDGMLVHSVAAAAAAASAAARCYRCCGCSRRRCCCCFS
jgi:hypothetical protein